MNFELYIETLDKFNGQLNRIIIFGQNAIFPIEKYNFIQNLPFQGTYFSTKR